MTLNKCPLKLLKLECKFTRCQNVVLVVLAGVLYQEDSSNNKYPSTRYE
jgi:hypothetical protein